MPQKEAQTNEPSKGGSSGNGGSGPDKTQNSEASVISPRQSASIIASTMIGIGVLTLPRAAVSASNQSGWLGIVLGTLTAMLIMWIISRLSRRFQAQSVITYGANLLTPGKARWLGKLLMLPFALLLFVSWGWASALVARLFGEVVSTTMLPTTPVEVIIITMLAAGFLLTMYAVEVLARVNEIMLPLIVVPILIIAISSFQRGRLENLFPLFEIDWQTLLNSVVITTPALLGFEVMLLLSANVQQGPSLIRNNLVGISIPGALYVLVAIAGISVFGYEELHLLAWPTLELVKSTEVPGLILERLESGFLAVWVTAVFTTLANYYYATSLILKQILNLTNHRLISVILLPVLYWVAMQPNNMQELFTTQTVIGNMAMGGAMGIPLFLGLLGVLRQRLPSEGNDKPAGGSDRAGKE
ncbi:GerAB/ArcD/ProY family transporter [Paenibacillus sp. 1P07SE]|uniref:GerAB/ArcD/ProY family transporter n=1 Tax=Paenibacillus sp. 1P07SE TaxID=3132209 RepID=UPI0039A74382